MSTELHTAVLAARTHAVVALRPELRTLEVVGPDRVEFLDGMLSQELRSLGPGAGTRALKCTAKGRVEAYVRVRAAEDRLLLDLRAEVLDRLLTSLAGHIVMEDCAVRDVSGEREVLLVLGPAALSMLEAVGLGAVRPELGPDAFERVGAVTVVGDGSFGLPGYELHVPPGSAEKRRQALLRAGALHLPAEGLEVLRIEAGVPRDGAELDLETLPMEARLDRAVSLTKGCYVGQEVVARGTNLGQVNHLLVGLRLEGGPPAGPPPVELSLDGQRVGELSSWAYSPALRADIGLGYVRREFERPGVRLEYPAGAASGAAVVATLPFISDGEGAS